MTMKTGKFENFFCLIGLFDVLRRRRIFSLLDKAHGKASNSGLSFFMSPSENLRTISRHLSVI